MGRSIARFLRFAGDIETGRFRGWLGWLGMTFTLADAISTLAVLNTDPNSPLGILGFIVFHSPGV